MNRRETLYRLIGPLFALIAVLLLAVLPIKNGWIFSAVAIFGLTLCSLYKRNGLILSLVILALLLIYLFFSGATKEKYWIGLGSSLAVSFFITLLFSDEHVTTLDDIAASEQKLRISLEDSLKQLQMKNQCLSEELSKKEAELLRFSNLLQEVESNNQFLQNQSDQHQTKLLQAQKELKLVQQVKQEQQQRHALLQKEKLKLEEIISKQSKENNRLESELNLARVDIELQKKKSKEEISSKHVFEEEKIALQNKLLAKEAELAKENRALRRSEGMLQQLRKQFNEKSDILDQTRRQLFLAEEELAKRNHENMEAQYASIISKDFEKYLLQLCKENETLDEETKNLEGVNDELIRKIFDKERTAITK